MSEQTTSGCLRYYYHYYHYYHHGCHHLPRNSLHRFDQQRAQVEAKPRSRNGTALLHSHLKGFVAGLQLVHASVDARKLQFNTNVTISRAPNTTKHNSHTAIVSPFKTLHSPVTRSRCREET